MKITSLRQRIASVQAQWLVLGIFEDDAEPPAGLRGTELEAKVRRLISEKELTGSLGELTLLYDVPGLTAEAVLLVGLGPRDRFDSGAAFSAGFALAKRLAGKPRESVAVALPPSVDPRAVASALIEGAIVGTRGPGLRKTEANRHAFDTLSLVVEPGQAEESALSLEPTAATCRDRRPGRQPGARSGEHSAWRQVAGAAGRSHRRRGLATPASP